MDGLIGLTSFFILLGIFVWYFQKPNEMMEKLKKANNIEEKIKIIIG